MSRGAVALTTAALLGGAFWVGSHSVREASAAPLVSYPIATNPGSTFSYSGGNLNSNRGKVSGSFSWTFGARCLTAWP